MTKAVFPSICALVCPDLYSLKITVEDGRVNDLTSERLTDLGGSSTFGNPVVQIERVLSK